MSDSLNSCALFFLLLNILKREVFYPKEWLKYEMMQTAYEKKSRMEKAVIRFFVASSYYYILKFFLFFFLKQSYFYKAQRNLVHFCKKENILQWNLSGF